MGDRKPRETGDEMDVVYGRNPVRELLRARGREAIEIFALDSVTKEDWLAGTGIPVRSASRDQLSRRAGSPDHQGVVALAQPFRYAALPEVIDRSGPVVCLDGAHDPRNVGAVARVLEAAGGAGLIIPARGGPPVTPAVNKASAGAVEHLPVVRAGNVVAALSDLRSSGRTVVGADPESGTDFTELTLPADPVLVVGAEGLGLRPKVERACDQLASIPMRGSVASLNLSVATGILLFSLPRIRG